MDCISNGLDTATTFDIIKSLRVMNRKFGYTTLVSLLQAREPVSWSISKIWA
eukprot:gene25619-31990_t